MLTEHCIDDCACHLDIAILDEPGNGGANHHYRISAQTGNLVPIDIIFQNGTIPNAGVNGITHEALLAIVADRLASFQNGPFVCNENAVALVYINLALNSLHKRTIKRVIREVEGKEIP